MGVAATLLTIMSTITITIMITVTVMTTATAWADTVMGTDMAGR